MGRGSLGWRWMGLFTTSFTILYVDPRPLRVRVTSSAPDETGRGDDRGRAYHCGGGGAVAVAVKRGLSGRGGRPSECTCRPDQPHPVRPRDQRCPSRIDPRCLGRAAASGRHTVRQRQCPVIRRAASHTSPGFSGTRRVASHAPSPPPLLSEPRSSVSPSGEGNRKDSCSPWHQTFATKRSPPKCSRHGTGSTTPSTSAWSPTCAGTPPARPPRRHPAPQLTFVPCATPIPALFFGHDSQSQNTRVRAKHSLPPPFSPGGPLLAGAPPAAFPWATSRRARPGPRRAMKTCSPPWRAGW